MSDINLSLDEIIKKRNIRVNNNSGNNNTARKKFIQPSNDDRFRKGSLQQPVDARLKLNRKFDRRFMIGDARDRIGLHSNAFRGTRSPYRMAALAGRLGDPLRRMFPDPDLGLDEDNNVDVDVMDMDLPSLRRGGGLLKTFKNDLRLPAPPLDWDRPLEADDFDRDWYSGYQNLITRRAVEPKGIMKRRLHEEEEPTMMRLRPKSASNQTLSDRFSNDDNARAERMKQLRARLVENQAKMQNNAGTTNTGYRIVVSNLRSTVTEEDIKELFEDIGKLISSKITHPGVAEVVFQRQEDALEAVEAYHNRQLDGQPMKCLLVKSSNIRNASGSKVEVDLNVLRNALHYKSHS